MSVLCSPTPLIRRVKFGSFTSRRSGEVTTKKSTKKRDARAKVVVFLFVVFMLPSSLFKPPKFCYHGNVT